MSQKQAQKHQFSPLRFLHDHNTLLVRCFIVESPFETSTLKHRYGRSLMHWCRTLIGGACIPAQMLLLAVVPFYKKTCNQHKIVIIPSRASPWRQIRPCPCRHSALASAQSVAVASWASEYAGTSVYLRAIWPDKSWENDTFTTEVLRAV